MTMPSIKGKSSGSYGGELDIPYHTEHHTLNLLS
jgi:hypothetical protein